MAERHEQAISTIEAHLDVVEKNQVAMSQQLHQLCDENTFIKKSLLELMEMMKLHANSKTPHTGASSTKPPNEDPKMLFTGPPMALNGKVMVPPTSQGEKNFCLFNSETFCHISVSTETTLEEFQNLSPSECVSDKKKIFPIGSVGFNYGKSLVSVNCMVYRIGGYKSDEPSNEVTKFDMYQPKLKLEPCCNMIQPRVFPAVVSISGKIYVFGGLQDGKENCMECPWAEFLDTTKPQGEQKWKALKEPVFRILKPFAVHYEAQTIFISSCYMDQGAMIYNVADESSLDYNFDVSIISHAYMFAPVNVFTTKTMYWIDDCWLRAYESDSHIYYQANMTQAFPDFHTMFTNTLQGPVLVHLKDDLFNMFTLFGDASSYPRRIGIVECTKLRVIKCMLKSGEGVLQVDRVGCQSYQCDSMWSLVGALPIEARRC